MPNQKIIQLDALPDDPSNWDSIEEHIKELFKREIYLPLMRELREPASRLKNAKENPLYTALRSGRVTFHRGTFSGKFTASISKALKDLGAKWDRKSGSFKATLSSLPLETRNLISATEHKFQEKIDLIDKKLAQKLPEEIAGRLSLSQKFDRTLWGVNQNFQESIRGITVAPQLTPERRRYISVEWEKNLKLYIKDFTQTEIASLRKNIKKSVFAGNRYESAVKAIQKSYDVSVNKAKFLARQETQLLVTKFKETRYADAGIYEYTWHNVAGSPAHPVRPRHKFLAEESKRGKIYRYDDPPITSEPGQPVRRNNPGQDFNCRCNSKPVVRFKLAAKDEKDRQR